MYIKKGVNHNLYGNMYRRNKFDGEMDGLGLLVELLYKAAI